MNRFWTVVICMVAASILGSGVAEGQPWARTLATKVDGEKGWLETVAAITAVVALIERILNALKRWKELRKPEPAAAATPVQPRASVLWRLVRFLALAIVYLLELCGVTLVLASLGLALQSEALGGEIFEALYWMLGGGLGLFFAGRLARNLLLRKSPRTNWALSAARTAFAALLVAAAIWGRFAG